MDILIVDDTSTARLLLTSWVKTWDFTPVVVEDGKKAWDILQQPGAPRLALVDWMMPEMDGLELCGLIKQTAHLPFTYVILLTSKNSQEDIVTGLNMGADDFITKPVQPDELHSRIKVGVRILEYQQRLMELDDQKNKLLGMVVHDLRNPLTSLQGFSQLLLHGGLEPATEKEFLTIISQVSQEMLVMLNDLLDLSKIDSGKLDLHLAEHDLAELLHYRVRLNAVNAQRKHICLQLAVPERLEVWADQERISQVLDNLINNAIKYSPPNTQILISAESHAAWVEIAVQDQGPGIPKDKQDKLFGMFQKVGVKPTGGEKSTGLGLAIVKKIIEAHNGSVGVDSAPGQGSRFYCRLPMQPAHATGEASPRY